MDISSSSDKTYALSAPKAKRKPNRDLTLKKILSSYKGLHSWIRAECDLKHLPVRFDYGLPKRNRSKDYVLTPQEVRLLAVNDQYITFISAWTHAYGMIRSVEYGTKNYGKLVRFVKFLSVFIETGISPIKEACHFWRSLALKNEEVPKTNHILKKDVTSPTHLFVASTLTRAISLPTEHLHAKAIGDAIDRWIDVFPSLEASLPNRLREFAFRLFKDTYSEEQPASSVLSPLVSSKACIEKSTKEGGCVSAIKHLHDKVRILQLDNYPTPLLDPKPGQGLDRISMEGMPGKMVMYKRMSEGMKRPKVPTTPYEAYRTARFFSARMYPAGTSEPKLALCPDWYFEKAVKPIAITELGEKVRVASLHPSTLAHFSRCMAQRTMPVLKRHRVFRKVLHGDTVRIQGVKGAKLYSADLTAASDYIDHGIGQAVLQGISDAFQHDEVTRRAMLNCLGPMEVQDPRDNQKKVTRNGAHMGLGTTWTTLSVLNLWAASNAGPPNSFAICGDDLIAAWTPKQVAIYDESIRRVGLVSNKSKSYYGEKGVFCELLMEKTTGGNYKSTALPRLAEITLARGPNRDSQSELTKLLQGSLLKQTRRTIELVLSRAKGLSGPTHAGGNGTKASLVNTVCLLQQYLTKGPVKCDITSESTKEFLQILSPSISKTTQKGGVLMKEAIVQSLCSLREDEVGRGIARQSEKLPSKVFNYKGFSRLKHGRKALTAAGVLQSRTTKKDPSANPKVAPPLPSGGSVFGSINVIRSYFSKLARESKHVNAKYRRQLNRFLRTLTHKNLVNLACFLTKAPKFRPSSYTTETELKSALVRVGTYTSPTSQNGTQGRWRWERGVQQSR